MFDIFNKLSIYYLSEQILPYLKEAITSGEIGKQSFAYTGFIFSPMNTYVKY